MLFSKFQDQNNFKIWDYNTLCVSSGPLISRSKDCMNVFYLWEKMPWGLGSITAGWRKQEGGLSGDISDHNAKHLRKVQWGFMGAQANISRQWGPLSQDQAVSVSWCNIVNYKKYTHDSWLTTPQTLGISWATGTMGASFVIIFGLLSSVPENASEPQK